MGSDRSDAVLTQPAGERVDLVPPEALADPYRRKSILRDLKVLCG